MKQFVVLVLALSMISGIAFAQDLFVRKDKTPEPKSELEELLDEAPDPAASEVMPEPQTINDFANQYYKNCTSQQHPVLKDENLELLCGCTSAQIPQQMTVEGMKALNEDSNEGKLQRGRMLLMVYAPCIQYPTYALVYNQCVQNPQIQTAIANYKKVCDCLGNGMGAFMKKRAPQHIEGALRRDIDNIDPLRDLLDSYAFEETSQYHMKRCIKEHGY